MASKKPNTGGRKVDKKGRSKKGERFVKLEHYFLNSGAWRSLKPACRALYIELAQRYNGANNGEISMSAREAARLVHVSKDTAGKLFNELEEKGFIKCRQKGSFNWKISHASTWILTHYPFNDGLPTKDYMSWKSENLKTGPKSGTNCPKSRTQKAELGDINGESVPDFIP